MVSAEMLFANLGILIMPPLFGVLAEHLSTDILPIFVGALCAFMVVFTILFFNKSKTQKF
jgi:fucose permease